MSTFKAAEELANRGDDGLAVLSFWDRLYAMEQAELAELATEISKETVQSLRHRTEQAINRIIGDYSGPDLVLRSNQTEQHKKAKIEIEKLFPEES